MRSLGDSTYFLKAAYEPLKEIMGDKEYEIAKDQIKGFIVHTDRIDGELLENVNDFLNNDFGSNFKKIHYNHSMLISWRDVHPEIPPSLSAKYDACKDYNDLLTVNSNYRLDTVGDGVWAWPLSALTSMTGIGNAGIFANSSAKHIDICIPSCTSYTDMCQNAFQLETFKADCSHILNGYDMFWNTPKLRIVDATFDSLDSGQDMFYLSNLDKKSALRILRSIPTHESGSHLLRIAIHVDNKSDEEVLEAIANAESRGWTLTLEWSGTPTSKTSATYGLRKPPIYAKVGERKLPDGTVEQRLDWGHYVTNPEDYQEFSSLEEAYEHFGLSNDLEN